MVAEADDLEFYAAETIRRSPWGESGLAHSYWVFVPGGRGGAIVIFDLNGRYLSGTLFTDGERDRMIHSDAAEQLPKITDWQRGERFIQHRPLKEILHRVTLMSLEGRRELEVYRAEQEGRYEHKRREQFEIFRDEREELRKSEAEKLMHKGLVVGAAWVAVNHFLPAYGEADWESMR